VPTIVSLEHSRKPGRPKKVIDPDFLRRTCAVHCNLLFTKLASILGVHRNTLWLYMKENGISREHSRISDCELDDLVWKFKKKKPESGLRYTMGFLRSLGLQIQYRRVIKSLKRTDALGRALRNRRVIQRRQYTVRRPNALWHVDGHHKLIRWGIVIHGFIDGYCRTVSQ
jgi:hypothetical protein